MYISIKTVSIIYQYLHIYIYMPSVSYNICFSVPRSVPVDEADLKVMEFVTPNNCRNNLINFLKEQDVKQMVFWDTVHQKTKY